MTEAERFVKDYPSLSWEIHRLLSGANKPKMSMTPIQKECFEFIKLYSKEQGGIAPSFEEMMKYLGLKSKSGVHRIITALEERGLIERLKNHARCIAIVEAAA